MAPWWLRTSDDTRSEEKETSESPTRPESGVEEESESEESKDTREIDVRLLRSDIEEKQGAARKKPSRKRSRHSERSSQDDGSESVSIDRPVRDEKKRQRRDDGPTAGDPKDGGSKDGGSKDGGSKDGGSKNKDKPRRRRRRRRRSREERAEKEPDAPKKPEKKSRAKPEKTSEKKSARKTKEKSKNRVEPSSKSAHVPENADRRPGEGRQKSDKSPEAPADELEMHPLDLEAEGIERNLLYSLVDRPTASDERKIAVFCDFENIAIGVRESDIKKLDINLVLTRLLQKGKIIVKKAYADWERYSEYKRPFHEAAIELIDIPQKYYSGKNSADIKMVVDAMDLCYSKEHLDTFVIVSGDSDFSPLVSKLKENNKYVIGIGVKNSSSSLLIDNCDEFIYYEDVWRMAQQRPHLDNLPPKQAEAFGLMSDAMLALMRENKDVLWGSLIKQTMQRMRPSFNESYYGYSTFSELLEDAARRRIIGLRRDQRSGNWVVTGFGVRR